MPIFTYQCDAGHEWDELRDLEGSEASEAPCAACLEVADEQGLDLGEDLSDLAGKKVPANFSPAFRGVGWTPKFYPGRKGK